MIYLSQKSTESLDIRFDSLVGVIDAACKSLADGDFAQPIKPYLRYRDPVNRIIAMPAFVGGATNTAGIKWIASFPKNIERGVPRAHSVVVLNEADTGRPFAIINGALLSIKRTAAVTGWMIRQFESVRPLNDAVVGMTGWGPIGRAHHAMATELLGGRIKEFRLFDKRAKTIEENPPPSGVKVVKSWQEAYEGVDVFITCTVADAPYVDLPPKPGTLHLNVSLRDYTNASCEWFRGGLIVDDWDEACREATDIERYHLECGLNREDTIDIADIVRKGLGGIAAETPMLFNPMGMAIFDVAVGRYLINAGREAGKLVELDD